MRIWARVRVRGFAAGSMLLWGVALGCSSDIDASAQQRVDGEAGEASAAEQEVADAPAGGRLYHGRSLDEWRVLIKDLELRDASSAEAVPGLIEIIDDSSAPAITRRQAALTLGRMGAIASDSVPVLTRLAQGDVQESTSLWAIKALTLLGPVAEAATPVLIAVTGDASRQLQERLGAIEALGRIGTAHPHAVPALIELVGLPVAGGLGGADDAELVRQTAADAISLVGAGASAAIPALMRVAYDAPESTRLKVFAALGTMGGRAEIAMPTMLEAIVFDESPAVGDAAEMALANVGPPALPALLKLVHSEDAGLRARGVRGLGRMGALARPASTDLERALADSDEGVRAEAAQALLKVSGDAAQVVGVLVESLTSRDRGVRMPAFRLLAENDQLAKAAVGPVEALLGHERADVRRIAEELLEKIRGRDDSDSR